MWPIVNKNIITINQSRVLWNKTLFKENCFTTRLVLGIMSLFYFSIPQSTQQQKGRFAFVRLSKLRNMFLNVPSGMKLSCPIKFLSVCSSYNLFGKSPSYSLFYKDTIPQNTVLMKIRFVSKRKGKMRNMENNEATIKPWGWRSSTKLFHRYFRAFSLHSYFLSGKSYFYRIPVT